MQISTQKQPGLAPTSKKGAKNSQEQVTTPPTEEFSSSGLLPPGTYQRLNLPDFSAPKPEGKFYLLLTAAANAGYLALMSGGGILVTVTAMQGLCTPSTGAVYLAGAVAGAAGLFGAAAGLVGKDLVPPSAGDHNFDNFDHNSDSGPSCR